MAGKSWRNSLKNVGVTVVQLREKELDFDAFVSLGKELQAVAKRHRIPFIINDAVDIGLGIGCGRCT